MSRVLDGVADVGDRQRLDAHLVHCENCAIVWDSLREASSLFESAPMLEPPADFVQSVMAELAVREERRQRWTSGLFLLSCLAVLALGVTGLAVWLFDGLASPLPGWSVLRQMSGVAGGLLRGLSVPLRILGPWPLAMALGGLIAVAASSTGLWTWFVVRLSSPVQTVAS